MLLKAIPIDAYAQSQELNESASLLSSPGGYEGRIRLVRFLDEPDGYCIDVPGPADRAILAMPAIAHTCHFDPLPDQVFIFNGNGNGMIRWEFGGRSACLTAASAQAEAPFSFEDCEANELQNFTFKEIGELRLSDSDLCLAVEATGPRFDEALEPRQDARGRGRPVNPKFSHLARALQLSTCGEGDPSFQRWQAYPD
ncbi:hypothetical protein SLH49_19905 [Cognatiyoonia sp. IB215446]|uniref:ricin-type beta-trefoil lectin domain protein n=1 Tax=Cognatiyoonia sp. IB215446 TaxID=3097355 RepID=UPI002A166F62|nr:ricin-type beta-trefoil lectin domain protein [Cognatiyoonia sp. IB215446]MDX8350263.1 hypothetical protein [Cognatiyoonia sp. IB215446]